MLNVFLQEADNWSQPGDTIMILQCPLKWGGWCGGVASSLDPSWSGVFCFNLTKNNIINGYVCMWCLSSLTKKQPNNSFTKAINASTDESNMIKFFLLTKE